MAETPIRMNGHGKSGGSSGGSSSPDDPQERAARLEREAEEIRRHLDGLLGELDRRRHAASDLTKQIGRYLVPAAISIVAIGVTLWATTALVRRRRARRRRLLYRVSALSHRLAATVGELDVRSVRNVLPW